MFFWTKDRKNIREKYGKGVSGKEMKTVNWGVDYCLAFLRQSIQQFMCLAKHQWKI